MTVTMVNHNFKIQFHKEENKTLNDTYELFLALLDFVDENSVVIAESSDLRWTREDIVLMIEFLVDIYNKTLIVTED